MCYGRFSILIATWILSNSPYFIYQFLCGWAFSFHFLSTINYKHPRACLLANICTHFGYTLETELLAHRVYVYTDLRDIDKWFPKMVVPIHITKSSAGEIPTFGIFLLVE